MSSAATTITGADSRPLLTVSDLHVSYSVGRWSIRKRPRLRAVDGVSFEVPRAQTTALVGESGCGKTTVARTILRLVPADGGTIDFDGLSLLELDGDELRQTRRRMQMVFQDPYGSLNPRLSVEGIIREPLDIFSLGDDASRRNRVAELIGLVGLPADTLDRTPDEFSGGQRQRIGIARALALEPDFIVADEPISALDVSIQAQILTLLDDLQKRLGLTFLLIAHDLSVVRQVSDSVVVMYMGQAVEIAPTDDLFSEPLHPYTIALMSAVPIPDPVIESERRRIILVGDVPSATNPPSGCRFHTRCWLRQGLGDPEICATTAPLLQAPVGTEGHRVACHFVDEARRSEQREAVAMGSEP